MPDEEINDLLDIIQDIREKERVRLTYAVLSLPIACVIILLLVFQDFHIALIGLVATLGICIILVGIIWKKRVVEVVKMNKIFDVKTFLFAIPTTGILVSGISIVLIILAFDENAIAISILNMLKGYTEIKAPLIIFSPGTILAFITPHVSKGG